MFLPVRSAQAKEVQTADVVEQAGISRSNLFSMSHDLVPRGGGGAGDGGGGGGAAAAAGAVMRVVTVVSAGVRS